MVLTLIVFFFFSLVVLANSLDESVAEKSFAIKSYQEIKLASPHDVFDMGVADINGDDILDIYTTGHYTRENLLLGDGKGNYTDALTRLGLDQARAFPYLEDMDADPVLEEPGLYIHRRRRLLIFRAHGLSEEGTISGRILVPSPADRPLPIQTYWAEHASADIINLASESGETWTKVQFSIAPQGTLVLDTLYIALPFEVTLDSSLPLNKVKVGQHSLPPKEHHFVLRWRDRHGVAWTELNGDEWLDVFMSTGGLRAALHRFQQSQIASDELLLSDGGSRYRDVAIERGIQKRDCRTYKPAWVDINRDNRLDLYVGCLGGPNQLYLQDSTGQFREVAKKYGLATRPGAQFVWLDVDQDGDSDLLADLNGDGNHLNPNFSLFTDTDSRVALFINDKVKFKRKLIPRPFKGSVMRFALGDFDSDGDQDVYVITARKKYRHESFLLVNNKGRLEPKDMRQWGLPKGCLSASWVDVDLDGKLDFHCLPRGIFYQAENGHFQSANEWTGWKAAQRARNGVSSWYDADNDGAWDVLMTLGIPPAEEYFKILREWQRQQAEKQGQTLKEWRLAREDVAWPLRPMWHWYHTRLYQGQPPANHWLQLELAGPTGNRNAIGARVELLTDEGAQVREVGVSEGAHFSQGHYRLYFGLGKSPQAKEVTIYWPDGKLTTHSDLKADQLLKISYP
ncbi:Integrins alpha chain [Nitrosococcus oceani ATCC 19707]|uniref:Integrins alpha chain n=1 Tax=Nitrosococcus oceani (strain ATCC 19707 / BCRC 17464 / JCM 30415 / NCIMB 11848 / C-107) TaxID=323261 RepID=Q3JD37_NITOC|nr:Integrins alpha chain [Nitrosococcus oceani ATCC 19707]